MKELLDGWLNEAITVLVGVVIASLWGFRERTHNERSKDVKTRLTTVESDLAALQGDHKVIKERVNTISNRQEQIAIDVTATLLAVTEIQTIIKERNGKINNPD